MSNETPCYECGKLKTALNKNSRCLTCVTQRSDFNENENALLRFEVAEVARERDVFQKKLATILEVIADDNFVSGFESAYQYRDNLLNVFNT